MPKEHAAPNVGRAVKHAPPAHRSPWLNPATWLAVAVIAATAVAIAVGPRALARSGGRGDASSAATASGKAQTTVRAGFLVNLTHAQALIGLADGTFARALGPDVEIAPRSFSAGPLAVEALLAGELDLLYVGPAPAVNAYVRTRGEGLRVLAGAMSGGSALVVRPDAGIRSPADLDGKRVASPSTGNTQEVSLRHLLAERGLRGADRGGSVRVLPMAPADAFSLFRRGAIDAAWLPEPWASRLILDAGGRLLIDERELWPEGRFATVVLAVAPRFLSAHPELVSRWADAHAELTERLRRDPDAARDAAGRELRRLVGKALPDPVVRMAWSRLEPTTDAMADSIRELAARAERLGYLGRRPVNLTGLFVDASVAKR